MSDIAKICRLGTYVVRMKNVNVRGSKTAKFYINYLQNENHDNHEARTEIISNIGDGEKFLLLNDVKVYKNKQHRKKVNRGRPLKVTNKSLTFNIPVDYEVTHQNCIDIQLKMIEWVKDYYKRVGNYDLTDIEYFSNVHYQNNSHINLVIPYLGEDGKILPFIKTKKRFFNVLAKEFTKVTDNVLGTNIKTYMTGLEQLAKSEEIMANMDSLTLSELEELKVKHKDNKLVKRAVDYVYRFMNAVDANEEVQAKHIDNINKTLGKIAKQDKSVSAEEFADLEDVMRKGGLFTKLSEEGKEFLKSQKPNPTPK